MHSPASRREMALNRSRMNTDGLAVLAQIPLRSSALADDFRTLFLQGSLEIQGLESTGLVALDQ